MIALLTLSLWATAIVAACAVVAGWVRTRRELRAQRERLERWRSLQLPPRTRR